jgi:hypothetical protein
MVPNGAGGVQLHAGSHPAIARAAVQQAQAFRLAAHELDPTHADAAWQMDYFTGLLHDEILLYYQAELSRLPA